MIRLLMLFAAAVLTMLSAPAFSQVTLAADSEPTDKPWTKPATLSYTRGGDGKSTTTADAYLKYTVKRTTDASSPTAAATNDAWSIAGYVHRNNADDAKKDDRGVALGYARLLVLDSFGSAGPMSMEWGGKITFGKSLVLLDDKASPEEYNDKTKEREKLYVSGFFQPALSGTPTRKSDDPKHRSPATMDMYFTWNAGLYSDHTAGGAGKGNGRNNGAMAGLEWNIMPFGMVAANNAIGDYGVAPVFTLAAQIEKDISASGQRKKDTYKLYTAMLTLEFDTIVDTAGSIGRLKPSLNFSRSIGADLLGGRPYEGKTEISFGLSF